MFTLYARLLESVKRASTGLVPRKLVRESGAMKKARTKAQKGKRSAHAGAAKPRIRGSLSQEVILQAALEIADHEGLANLTLRKIATHLGASPMAIYRHFRNKAALVAKLPDLVVGRYAVTAHATQDWREWISVTLVRMRAGLLEHPGVIPLLGSNATSGPNAFAVMDRFLAVVRSAGIEDAAAVQLFHILMSYTVGSVALESAAAPSIVQKEKRRKNESFFFEAAPQAEYPHLVALAPQLARFASAEFFEAGVCRIVGAFAESSPEGQLQSRGRFKKTSSKS